MTTAQNDPMMITPVILCGGSGTRLWPSSRQGYPKQFAALIGKDSLFQATLRRLSGPAFDKPLVMTNEAFRFMAQEQAAEIGMMDAEIVVEPHMRDTAAAILSAALMLEDRPEQIMLVAPSDHVITDNAAFQNVVLRAAEAALETGALMTFGIAPDRPETGYGYLELGTAPQGSTPLPLTSFREKPDQQTAEAFLKTGTYLWNAGIFLFRVKDVIAAFAAHAPDLVDPCRAAVQAGAKDVGLFRLGAEAYAQNRKVSFDYAIMEQARSVMAVPFDGGWSDLGSWESLWQAEVPDEAGLATHGAVTALDCRNTYLRSEEPGMHLVGLGLDGIVAVAMRDAILVANKARSQEVKQVVELLKAAEVDQATHYPRFHRPWGWYETLCMDRRFQVKRIMVRPGGTLSLQSHMHRSEHWVVVAGTAEVTIGQEVKLVTENEGVYIPLGMVHRMANPGRVPMYLIEVQTGTYLGEDDIIRYEDVYNRV